MPNDDDLSLQDLELEVVAELTIAHIDDPEKAREVPQSEWLFGPTELEREEVGLRNLLGAVRALEHNLPQDAVDDAVTEGSPVSRLPRLEGP